MNGGVPAHAWRRGFRASGDRRRTHAYGCAAYVTRTTSSKKLAKKATKLHRKKVTFSDQKYPFAPTAGRGDRRVKQHSDSPYAIPPGTADITKMAKGALPPRNERAARCWDFDIQPAPRPRWQGESLQWDSRIKIYT